MTAVADVPAPLAPADTAKTRPIAWLIVVVSAAVPWLKVSAGPAAISIHLLTLAASIGIIVTTPAIDRRELVRRASAFSGLAAGLALLLVGAIAAQVFTAVPYYETIDFIVAASRFAMCIAVGSLVVQSQRSGGWGTARNRILRFALVVFAVAVVLLPLTQGHNFVTAAIDGLASGNTDAVTNGAFRASFATLEPTFNLPRISANLRYPLVLMIVVGIGSLRGASTRGHQLLVGSGTAIVLLSFSRAAILALVLGAIAVAVPPRVREQRRRSWAPAVGLLVLVGTATAIATPGPFDALVGRLYGQDNRSYTTRSNAIDEAIGLSTDSLLGLDMAGREITSPHLALLDGLFGAGILGTVGMTLIVVTIARIGYLTVRRRPRSHPHRTLVVFCCAVILVRAFTAGSFLFDAPAWFAAGLIAATHDPIGRSPRRTSGRPTRATRMLRPRQQGARRLSDGLLASIAQVLAISTNLLFVWAATRLVEKEEVGAIAWLIEISRTLGVLAVFGLTGLTVASVSGARGRGRSELMSTIVRAALAMSAVIIGAWLAVGWLVIPSGDVYSAVAPAVALWIPLTALSLVFEAMARADRDFLGALFLGEWVRRTVLLVLLVTVVASGIGGIRAAVMLTPVVAALAAAIGARRFLGHLRDARRQSAPGSVPQLLRSAVPFVPGLALASMVPQAGAWLGAFVLEPDEVADVAIATRLAFLATVPTLVFTRVLGPRVARVGSVSGPLGASIQRAARVSTATAAAGLAALVLVGGPAIAFVFGEEYRTAVAAAAVLVGGMAARSFFGLGPMVLANTGHVRIAALWALVGVALFGLLSLPMGSMYGAAGISLAASCALLVHAIGSQRSARRLGFETRAIGRQVLNDIERTSSAASRATSDDN